MIKRKRRLLFSECFGPFVSDFNEMRICAGAEIGHGFRQRIREILIVADTESMALHDDLAAEAGGVVVERDDGSALFEGKNGICDRIAAQGERRLSFVPIDGIDSLLDGRHSNRRLVTNDSREKVRVNLSDIHWQIAARDF